MRETRAWCVCESESLCRGVWCARGRDSNQRSAFVSLCSYALPLDLHRTTLFSSLLLFRSCCCPLDPSERELITLRLISPYRSTEAQPEPASNYECGKHPPPLLVVLVVWRHRQPPRRCRPPCLRLANPSTTIDNTTSHFVSIGVIGDGSRSRSVAWCWCWP